MWLLLTKNFKSTLKSVCTPPHKRYHGWKGARPSCECSANEQCRLQFQYWKILGGGTNRAGSLTLKRKGDRGTRSKCTARTQLFFSHGRRGPNATKIHESSLSIQEWEEANGSFCPSLFLPTAEQSPGDWDTPAVCPGSHKAVSYRSFPLRV